MVGVKNHMSITKPIYRLLLLIIIISGIFPLGGISKAATKKIYVDTIGDSEKIRELPEVVVKKKKEKYSKKNNPAVELMRAVRKMHDTHAPEDSSGYTFDQYDKIVVGINDIDGAKSLQGLPLKNNLQLVVDTGPWLGKRVLNLSIKEKTKKVVHTDGGKKEIVTGINKDGLDQAFDDEFTRVFFEDLLKDVDLYKNDVKVMRANFVSPLSAISADYYKFYIEDTVKIGGERCIELSFAPHRPEFSGFNGKLFVPLDDSIKYVKRALLRMPKAANVNYVKDLVVSVNYERDSLGKVHKVLDDIVVDLQILPGTPRLFVTRQSRRSDFGYDGSPEYKEYLEKIGSTLLVDNAQARSKQFWEQSRQLPLTYAEQNMLGEKSPYKTNKIFYWLEKGVMLLAKGYIPTANKSKFDIGPINNLVSYTAAGGWRLQFGGITTANLMPHLFLRGYGAYGFGDKKWKYGGEVEYTFNKKKYHALEFPRNGIKVSYNYDFDQLGQQVSWDGGASLTGSFTRVDNILVTYRRHAYAEYNKEWNNNLSISTSLHYDRQEASRWVNFITGDGHTDPYYDRGLFRISLRYAPGEKFIQTNNSRKHVNWDAWVFNISQEYGPRGMFGSKFNYVSTNIGLEKRFWFSAFGYLDMNIKTGKIWTQVPFISLAWQNSNISYFMRGDSFCLLNPMEFAMDQYATLYLQYHLNGLLLNNIPIVKKAKLREVVTFRGFMGHLSKRNNPDYNPNLYKFPDKNTVPMGMKPYMELAVGIENIFTFIKLDYVWRLSYLNRPDISKSGIRFSFVFNM